MTFRGKHTRFALQSDEKDLKFKTQICRGSVSLTSVKPYYFTSTKDSA